LISRDEACRRDVGGTFTDLVLFDTAWNATHVHKVSSTPDNPSCAVVAGILKLCRRASIEGDDRPRLPRHDDGDRVSHHIGQRRAAVP
jgi:hypothetical protein